MTDLTEQWKKGELSEGWYYIEGNRVEGIYAYTAEYLNNMYRPRNGERIIAKVPSYEELQNINKSVNDLMASNIKLVEENKHLAERLKKTQELELEVRRENTKLKELLKECREVIKNVDTYYGNYDSTNGFLIVEKINQALGEE